MGLIATTGRRSPRTVLLLAGIFLILTAGAVTMLVPFLLMLTGSTHTGVDRQSFEVVPGFLSDETLLYRKYIEGLYNESPSLLRSAWGEKATPFDEIELLDAIDRDNVAAWQRFVETYAPGRHELTTGFTACPESRGRPWTVRKFLALMHQRYDGSISAANQALNTTFQDWNAFTVLPPDTRSRLGVHPDTPWWQAWEGYMANEAPDWSRRVYALSGYYQERVLRVLDGQDAAMGSLPATVPEQGEARERWELFVREVVHPAYIRVSEEITPAWQAYLQTRYVDLATFTGVTGLQAARWEDIALPLDYTGAGDLQSDWLDWLQGWQQPVTGERFEMPLSAVSLVSVDLAWMAETGEPPPIPQLNQLQFETNRKAIRNLFLYQNYGTVWEILILHGRGLWVTVVYCSGAVLIALIVNPMAAYALSRFRPRNSYALLLYLLLTMAFPPMVTQIPLFLMLRDLQLLNTFWALLLPGMAHGYSIFLLKGFFDSLPRDLYESAALDGAGEMRMFVTITLSLSKPILAVIALSAFVNAYTSFMFALLICQDERMWTLMVWLYQLQQTYGSGVMNAAFVLAALPTLLVFLAAQQQILKGIVIPSEK